MLRERLVTSGDKLAKLAEAFPESQYESAPVAGVRTFAATLRHVAFWNLYLAGALRGLNPDGSANELLPAETPTKPKLIAALVASTAEASTALRGVESGLDPERAALAESFIEHLCEHYGQLALYARWAGTVPPASLG